MPRGLRNNLRPEPTLLHQPSRALGRVPELDALVVLAARPAPEEGVEVHRKAWMGPSPARRPARVCGVCGVCGGARAWFSLSLAAAFCFRPTRARAAVNAQGPLPSGLCEKGAAMCVRGKTVCGWGCRNTSCCFCCVRECPLVTKVWSQEKKSKERLAMYDDDDDADGWCVCVYVFACV